MRNRPLNRIDPSGHEDTPYDGGGGDPPVSNFPRFSEIIGPALVVGVSIFVEPVDWFVSGIDCVNGDCSGLALAFIPFVSGKGARTLLTHLPTGLVRHGDEVLQIGQWVERRVGMSDSARAYQKLITGAEEGWEFLVNGTRFDGARLLDSGEVVLLDAKFASGADSIYAKVGESWAQANILAEARRQVAAAGTLAIEWHVSDALAATELSKLFEVEKLKIAVKWSPIQP